MADDAFILAILAAPNDDAPRHVYADWLEEQGDPRSAFLRAECALAASAPDSAHHDELQARLREASAGVDLAWLTTVSRIPLENCGVSFRVRCPKRWEQLKLTRDETVRFCETCRQQVFFCDSLEVAQTHAAVGECIALDPRLVRKPRDLESNVWDLETAVGMLLPGEEEPDPKPD